jgi:hypothetical protein
MSVYVRKVDQGWRVCIENKQTGNVDWPIRYENGAIAYDHLSHTKQDIDKAEKTFSAMHDRYGWTIWEWELLSDMSGGSFVDRCRFKLAGVTNERWPCHGGLFSRLAEKLGYDKVIPDKTLIGGYYVNPSGDCLVCVGKGILPWKIYVE